MTATMASHGGRIQLEQSDMRLALNMATMAKGEFLRAAMEETYFLINKPRAGVREDKKRGVELPGHEIVKAAIKRHLAMLWENQMDGCLPCQNDKAQNHQTRWRLVLATGRGNPPAVRLLAGGSVQFCAKPGQNPDPLCLGGFVTRTGHRTVGFWPGWNRTVVPNLRFPHLWLQ